jgi:multidrug transporter EmrE-like cation transporter
MTDLLLAIACSSLIGLLLKAWDRLSLDRAPVAAANYAAAAALALARGAPSEPAGCAAACGIPAGLLYLLGLLWYQKSVAACGVGLTGGFGKLGVLIPMALSAVVWGEVPGGAGLAGAVVAAAALAAGIEGSRGVKAPLLLFFVFGGLAEFSGKVFRQCCGQGSVDTFLFFVFTSALVLSLAVLRPRLRVRPVLAGLALGVPNYYASWFLLRSLRTIPGPVAFGAYGAGTVALLGLAGFVALGERRSPRRIASVCLATAAVLLLASDG